MEKKDYSKLLDRFCSNHLSKDELAELFDWINSPEGEAEYDQYLSAQLDTMEVSKIGSAHFDPDLMLRSIKKKANIRKTYTFGWHEIRKYAAILVIALLTGSLMWLATHPTTGNDNIVFAMSKGNKGTLILPDGSEVWLNAESKITYAGNDQRKINLEGEAFLQVAKDRKRRFVVNTPFADIIVYGTAFNVTAYPADSTINVSLVEGSVGIKIAGQDDITHITPGQVASFDARNKTLELYDKDLTDVALWRNNELLLVDANINTLCRKMEAWYGVRITLENQPVKNHSYNMTIRNESIDEILELINKITPIAYHIQEKEVNIRYIN